MCSLLQQHSRCSVAACIFSKVVILLHVLHVSCGQLGEVLRASIVHVIRRCKVKVLSFIFPLILHLWKNFCKPERQTLIIQDHLHENRKVAGSYRVLLRAKARGEHFQPSIRVKEIIRSIETYSMITVGEAQYNRI